MDAERNEGNQFIAKELEYGAHNYTPIPVVIEKGKGIYVWDVDGNRYIDCLSAYSALNFGHRHPKIMETMIQQAQKLHLTSRAFFNNVLGEFLQKLSKSTGMERVLPMNTGAEAVETSIKIARRWGYRKKRIDSGKAEIIACENNFHGRTTTIIGFSSDPNSYSDFGPATPGFIKVPFNDPEALEQSITENTAAFLVEPIQGEAGIIVPDDDYLGQVSSICNRHNVLLILDEIQTGLGRTGKNFAFQHYDIKPDILCLGKALGGGVYPVSAALARGDVMDVITPGSHGSTFGGNPLGAAIAICALELLESGDMAKQARLLGIKFLKFLQRLADQSERIKEVRGKGLLLAIEFKKEYGPARDIVLNLKDHGILVKETHKYTIRIAPPLVITQAEINKIQDVLTQVILNKND